MNRPLITSVRSLPLLVLLMPGVGQGQDLALPAAQDLSPWGMYENADLVVKAVLIGLVAAVFVTWTIWLYKTVEGFAARRRARRVARLLGDADTLAAVAAALGGRRDPAAFMVQAVAAELVRSGADAVPAGIRERAASLVGRIELQAVARLRRGMGVLASIGAVAPFVGLFGTVWGIMNAFIGIAETHTTNLAVVAPGIAEALFATAMGLVAAIPAVVIYNAFSRGLAAYRLVLGDAGAAALRLLSRELDRRPGG